MTPLIDVSLVLVIILLLATPLAFESRFRLRQTQTANTETSVEAVPTRLQLNILSDSEVQVGQAVVDVRDLPGMIAPLIAAAESKEVAVRCADRVSHGTFVQVLDIAKLSGAADIAVAGN